MCLAASGSSVGKGAKAGVAGPAGAALAGPTFFGRVCYPQGGYSDIFIHTLARSIFWGSNF